MGEVMAAYLPQVPDTTCLLFVESEVDKRSKLYKAVRNTAIQRNWDVRILTSWLDGRRESWRKTEKNDRPHHGTVFGEDRR